MPRLVYAIIILNIVSANIFFQFGKMIGIVRSCEIDSPPTGGAGRKNLSCVVPASVIHI